MRPSRPTAPLSPPTSPRMSGQDSKPSDSTWHTQQAQSAPLPQGRFGAQASAGLGYSPHSYSISESQQQPLGNFGSLPQRSDGSDKEQYLAGISYSDKSQMRTDPFLAVKTEPQSAAQRASDQMAASISAPGRDSNRYSPRSPADDDHDAQGDEEDLELDMDDPQEEDSKVPMTAAEIRQQKRKMKRFRY